MRVLLVTPAQAQSGAPLPDAPLSGLGRRQAEALSDHLIRRGQAVAAVYTSPARAAQETASILAAGLAAEVETSHDLPARIANAATPDELLALQAATWSTLDALREMQAPEAALLLVAHETVVRVLVGRALELSFADLARFQLAPGSLTTLDFGRRTLLFALNDVCHLDALPAD